LLVDEVGRYDCDDAVPEPVGGRGEADSTRADGEREDFADHHPGAWSPLLSVSWFARCQVREAKDEGRTYGAGEHGDVDADECNHCRDRGLVEGPVGLGFSGCFTDYTDDVLGDDHSRSAEDEEVAATDPLDEPK
jgi:hypothetical protein